MDQFEYIFRGIQMAIRRQDEHIPQLRTVVDSENRRVLHVAHRGLEVVLLKSCWDTMLRGGHTIAFECGKHQDSARARPTDAEAHGG